MQSLKKLVKAGGRGIFVTNTLIMIECKKKIGGKKMKQIKAHHVEYYKGYAIKDYSKYYKIDTFSVPGCLWFFSSPNAVKSYIDKHDRIFASESGSMVYKRG